MTTSPGPTGTPGTDQPARRPRAHRGRRPDGPSGHVHAAIDALDRATVPSTDDAKGLAGRDQAAER